jgi:hypothetical protein
VSDLAYLDGGLVRAGRLRDDLAASARSVATGWLQEGVEAAAVELLAEQLARWATLLGEATANPEEVVVVVEGITRVPGVADLVRAAAMAAAPLTRLELGAIAVHLLDIAEAMALQTYIPELPALHARSDRSGDAARNVGLARHLKG